MNRPPALSGRSGPGRTTAGFVLVVLAIGVLLGACGGEDSAGKGDEGTAGSTGPGADNDQGGSQNVKKVRFVPAGPTDDDTPRGNQWYVFLSKGQCQALRDDTTAANSNDLPVILYRAAAEACTGQHDQAARDLQRYLNAGIPIDPEDCGRAFVIEFVQDVLNAAKANPGASITFEPSSPKPPCEQNDTTTSARRSTTTTIDTTE